MPHPRYARAEMVQRGQTLYEHQIQTQVETGDYDIDAEDVRALPRAKAKHPDRALYLVRIGSPTAYR
jgi:hypothetical protein